MSSKVKSRCNQSVSMKLHAALWPWAHCSPAAWLVGKSYGDITFTQQHNL